MIEPVARLMIELQEIEPRLWRRVDVPLSSTLLALHDIIQVVVGWTDSHLFEFVIGERVYGEPLPDDDFWDRRVCKAAGIRLKALVQRGVERCLYVYDFGDDWRHDIFIESVGWRGQCRLPGVRRRRAAVPAGRCRRRPRLHAVPRGGTGSAAQRARGGGDLVREALRPPSTSTSGECG